MPFKSEKQRKWMHANKPEMAKKWEKKKKTELVPNMAVINPDAQAKLLQRAKDREIRKGVKLATALANKNDDDHNKAKSIWQKIKDRITKNRKEYAMELVKRVKEQQSVNERRQYQSGSQEMNFIVQQLVKYGNTKSDAIKMTRKHYNHVIKRYRDSHFIHPVKKAEIISSLSANESVNEDVLNEATYVKGKMMVILKNSFNQVHSSLVKNVSLSDSMDDNTKSRLAMFQKRMSAAREDYVKAVMRASKPFDKELTGV